MKSKKMISEMIYMGCGFPVILKNVPTILIRGKLEPKIPYQSVDTEVLKMLCKKTTPLTGNEVRFMRLYFGMALRKFAEEIGITHQAVMKWEDHEDDFARISPGIEKMIRLDALFRLKPKASEFFSIFASLQDLPKTLQNNERKTTEPLKLAI